MARGISRSGTIEETINSIKKIIITDVKEIVLSGINILNFKFDFGIFKSKLSKLSKLDYQAPIS